MGAWPAEARSGVWIFDGVGSHLLSVQPASTVPSDM